MEQKNFLIISGCPGAPHRYRCEHKKEQLELRGHSVRIKDFYDYDLHTAITDHDLIILYRVPFNYFLWRLLIECRLLKIPFIFDVDDMVFMPSLTPYASALYTMSLADVDLYIEGVRRYEQTLKHIDTALVSTHSLQQYMKREVPSTYVVPNVISLNLISLSEKALEQKSGSNNGRIVLGYLSGSPTHDNDLHEISYPLSVVMGKYPGIELRLIGDIHVPDILKPFMKRITALPFMKWTELQVAAAQLDINLAPLEIDNPHCDVKSGIKFMEAGLVKVPTVATATGPFREIIRHDETGYLASTGSDWIEILDTLVNNTEKRYSVGTNAYNDVLNRFHPEKAGQELERILMDIISNYTKTPSQVPALPETVLSYFDPLNVRKLSDRAFWFRTKIRHLRFHRMHKSTLKMDTVPLVELRESRSMGQEFLLNSSSLAGFMFPVYRVSGLNTANIQLDLAVNSHPVPVETITVELVQGSNVQDMLYIRFPAFALDPLAIIYFTLRCKDPVNGTGIAFLCNPFSNSPRYRRYHNDRFVHGTLLFEVIEE